MNNKTKIIEIVIDGIIVKRIETLNFSTQETKNYKINLKQFILTYF